MRSDADGDSTETSLGRHQSQSPSSTTGDGPPSHSPSSHIKPRIWSLADLAASPTYSQESSPSNGGKLPLHRPLHLDASPYGRPLGPSRLTPPQEALLQVYAKSLGLGGPPPPYPPSVPHHGLPPPPPGFPSLPLPMGSALPLSSPASTLLSHSISRPIATRSLLPPSTSVPHHLSSHLLAGGGRVLSAPSQNT